MKLLVALALLCLAALVAEADSPKLWLPEEINYRLGSILFPLMRATGERSTTSQGSTGFSAAAATRSHLSPMGASPTNFEFHVMGEQDSSYLIESSDDLSNWVSGGSVVISDASTASLGVVITDTESEQQTRQFYRLKELPPGAPQEAGGGRFGTRAVDPGRDTSPSSTASTSGNSTSGGTPSTSGSSSSGSNSGGSGTTLGKSSASGASVGKATTSTSSQSGSFSSSSGAGGSTKSSGSSGGHSTNPDPPDSSNPGKSKYPEPTDTNYPEQTLYLNSGGSGVIVDRAASRVEGTRLGRSGIPVKSQKSDGGGIGYSPAIRANPNGGPNGLGR